EYDRALADCNVAVRLDPKGAYHYFTRGKVFEYAGNDERAQPDYAEAINLDPSYEQRAPRKDRRYLRVANNTGQAVEVTGQYEAHMTDGTWKWHVATWNFEPGETASLNHDGWKVNARRMRIWAQSKTHEWVGNKNKDVWLAPEPYRASGGMSTFTFTF